MNTQSVHKEIIKNHFCFGAKIFFLYTFFCIIIDSAKDESIINYADMIKIGILISISTIIVYMIWEGDDGKLHENINKNSTTSNRNLSFVDKACQYTKEEAPKVIPRFFGRFLGTLLIVIFSYGIIQNGKPPATNPTELIIAIVSLLIGISGGNQTKS